VSRLTRRLGVQALLWAAPLGVMLALSTLFAASPFFAQGRGTPSAGDERAWNAIWGAFGFVGAGCLVGLVATTAWLARSWSRAHRPSGWEWFRSAVNLLFAAAFLWLWLG
jgi:hypothetical protein